MIAEVSLQISAAAAALTLGLVAGCRRVSYGDGGPGGGLLPFTASNVGGAILELGTASVLIGDDSDLAVGTSGSCVVSDGSVVPAAFVGWEGPYDWDAVVATESPELLDLAPETIQSLGALGHVGQDIPDDPPPFHLRSGDLAFNGHYHSDFQVSFDEALSAVGWPVTAEVLPSRHHTAFFLGYGIPEMIDLIVDVAYNPSG